jgi:ribose-phosphate pyrophosphokinase
MIYLNGQPLSVTMFPDNTSQVWKLPENLLPPKTDKLIGRYAEVTWTFSSEGEFLQLAQLKDLLDEHEINTSLVLTYLPYGRQDKEVSNEATFALRTFAKLLNSLNFQGVTIVDPHSKVALDLIENSDAVYPTGEVYHIIKEVEADILCYPDKGARSKYQFIYDFPSMYGEKVRDQSSGQITSYQIVGDPTGKNVLIVDDICDGGATFKLLAKDLLAAGAKSVVLFVTHGIFSKGTRTLFESGIQRVFTKDGEVGARTGSIQF